jgi:putative membrane protein
MIRAWALFLGAVASILSAGCEKPIDSSTFASSAGQSIQFQIATSRLAVTRATGGYVKLLARQIISEYEASTSQLAVAAKEMGVRSLPAGPDNTLARNIEELKDSEGTAFDQLYLEQQLKAHEDAVDLYTRYAARGEDGPLKQFAKEKLGLLEAHLSHVRGMRPVT